MHSGSIVKLSTRKARRAVFAALLGFAVVASCFLIERLAFQEQLTQRPCACCGLSWLPIRFASQMNG